MLQHYLHGRVPPRPPAGDWCRIHRRDFSNQYGQKGHDQGPEEYNAIYDFADEFFFGKPRGPGTFNAASGSDTWCYHPGQHPLLIDWDVWIKAS